MIKLANILKEDERDRLRKQAYSWQRKDGTFLPIKYSHGSDAWQLLGKPTNTDSVMELWKRGWNRIWFNHHTLFCHNELMPPSEKQKTSLIELAMALELQEVEFDAGEGSQILWSVYDKLEESRHYDWGDISRIDRDELQRVLGDYSKMLLFSKNYKLATITERLRDAVLLNDIGHCVTFFNTLDTDNLADIINYVEVRKAYGAIRALRKIEDLAKQG